MQSSIYKILNRTNNKFYLGSAVNFKKRWWVHLCRLRQGRHDNKHLQAAYNQYGEDAFEFIIIEICPKEELLKREQVWLNWTKCFNREIGYNACTVAGSSIGYKHTPEIKAAMSAKRTGIKRSEETKAKMSKSARKPKTEEHAANISKGKTGKSRFEVIITQTPLMKKEDGSWH